MISASAAPRWLTLVTGSHPSVDQCSPDDQPASALFGVVLGAYTRSGQLNATWQPRDVYYFALAHLGVLGRDICPAIMRHGRRTLCLPNGLF